MAFDTKQYIEQLAQAAGLSDEDKAGILKVAGNDKFAKALGDDVLRQQDYSRNMDKLKTDQQKTSEYYQSLVTWKADQERLLAESQQHQTVQQVQSGFTKEEFEKRLAEENAKRDGQVVGLLKTGLKLQGNHWAEFKEPLDIDGLEKLAIEKKLSLEQAYSEMVGPRRTTMNEEQLKAKIAEAKAEGAREFASTHKIPVDTQPREYHPIFDRDPKKQVGADDYVPNSGRLSPQSERNLRDNFVQAWETAPRSTSGT